MSRKLCLIFNQASHYREAIYCAIDKEYDCDWYFSDCRDGIKQMDLSLLKNTFSYKIYRFHNIFYWERGIIKLLFKKEYQVFLKLGESRSLSGYVFNWIAKLMGKKVYLWTHGWYGKEKGLNAIIKLRLFKNATGIFTYGDYAKKLLAAQGIPADKIFSIHNSLNYDKQIFLRQSINLGNVYTEHFGNNNPVIIVIGRLNLRKKLQLLLEAVAILKSRGEDYNIILIGEGEDKSNLEELSLNLKIENNVWFYGACYDESENAKLIINSDLCVVPGDIGLTAIHVMTFGVPVITHNSFMYQGPEFETIKEGVTGMFFKRDDVDDVANKISAWFNQKLNSRDEVRFACYEEIDKYWNPDFQINVIKCVLSQQQIV